MKALYALTQRSTKQNKEPIEDLNITTECRRLSRWCWGFSLAVIASVGSMRSAHAEAETGKYQADIFLPNSMFFTGQKNAALKKNHWLAILGRGLDSEALEQVARDVRANNMSSAQRVLNYHWLGHQYDNDVEYDGDAVSALMKFWLRTLWDQYRTSNAKPPFALPDSSGRGTFNLKQRDVGYKLKISSDEFGITLNYNF